MCATFLRFQEFYESPEFAGKVFSIEEFIPWYTANSPKGKATGKFTYYTDWKGFNIPSHILEPFYKGAFNPLSEKEAALLHLFKPQQSNDFYIIGTCDLSTAETLTHEIAHGLFYTNPDYRRRALEIVRNANPMASKRTEEWFTSKAGYGQHVWDDEKHAYWGGNLDRLAEKGLEIRNLGVPQRELQQLFLEYAGQPRMSTVQTENRP